MPVTFKSICNFQMNSANMWGRPIKVGRPTQAQPYLKTIDSTVYESKRSPVLYISGIQQVSVKFLDQNSIFLEFLNFSALFQIRFPHLCHKGVDVSPSRWKMMPRWAKAGSQPNRSWTLSVNRNRKPRFLAFHSGGKIWKFILDYLSFNDEHGPQLPASAVNLNLMFVSGYGRRGLEGNFLSLRRNYQSPSS